MHVPVIRICLVEDDIATREGLVRLLQHAPEIVCLGAFSSAEEAEQRIPALVPDVVLMDINLPGRSGIDCVMKLKRDCRKIEFVMLTTYDSSQLIFEALKAGASGYLLKRSAPDELLSAIMEVRDGGSPMSMQIARKVVAYFRQIPKTSGELEALTEREGEILALLAKGLAYKQIADRLAISPSTVHGHLNAVYKKLHVQSGTEAVLKFLGKQP
jgi:DNA-binding NarL/FixJ family response regulator